MSKTGTESRAEFHLFAELNYPESNSDHLERMEKENEREKKRLGDPLKDGWIKRQGL